MSFVLDCSAVVPWIFEEEATPQTDRILDELASGETAWVPALWHLELANVLLGAERRGRISRAIAESFLVQLELLDIRVDDETISRAWGKTLDLARQYQVSSYDAAYLEVCLRRSLPLATLDQALAAAAKATGVNLRLPVRKIRR